MASIRLDNAMDAVVLEQKNLISQLRTRLEAASPQKILDRGYVLVTDGERVITDVDQAPDRMILHFRKGMLKVRKDEEVTDGCEKENDL